MNITRIKNIKTYVLSTFLLSATASCVQKPYIKMPKENISKVVSVSLDSLVEESIKIKKDTLLLWKDFNKKIQRYLKGINQKALLNVPKSIVDKKTVLIPTRVGNTTVMRQHIKIIKEPNYIETKAVISSNQILTKDSVEMYVPVEYYGKANPKIRKNKK